MKERPILFSAPMVVAILEGRKTQTRRIMKPQPEHLQHHEHSGHVVYEGEHRMWCWKNLVLENIWDFPDGDDRKQLAAKCPHGVSGDRLWVRETFMWADGADCREHFIGTSMEVSLRPPHKRWWYRATDAEKGNGFKWRPSIFMPRSASRITLGITEVRVQRLQDISEADCLAEGIIKLPASGRYVSSKGAQYFGSATSTARGAYCDLWRAINGADSWDSNPWVWAITFTAHKKE